MISNGRSGYQLRGKAPHGGRRCDPWLRLESAQSTRPAACPRAALLAIGSWLNAVLNVTAFSALKPGACE